MPTTLAAFELLPPVPEIPTDELDHTWLAAWQKRNNFSNEGAANRLALSASAFYRQKKGKSRVSQQTILLAIYTEVHRHNWLNIAELAYRLAKVNGGRR